MKKEFEIYQDNKGNVYTITTELEQLLLKDIVKLHSIIKEVREYANTDKNCVPKHIKDYINNLLDKENKC